MVSALVSVPEGFTEAEVADIAALARADPERCMILVDHAMRTHSRDVRKRWIAMAQILYFVDEHKLWRHHPANFTSIFLWAAQDEIGIHASTVSEMLAVVRFAPSILEQCETDLFALIEDVGTSHVRMLIPAIRKAYRNGTMKEELTPLLDEVRGSSFRDVLQMISPGGQRTGWDPEVIYEEVPGGYNVTFVDLDFDQLELLAGKAGIKRWYDTKRRRIDPPINALVGEDIEE